MAIKVTREELEQDELARTLAAITGWYQRRRALVWIGLVVAAAVVGSAAAYRSYQERVRLETSGELNRANVLFGELPNIQDDADREKRLKATIDSLQRLIDQYPGWPATRAAIYLQGNCYFYMDDMEKAQASFQKYLDQARDGVERAKGEIAIGNALENQFYFTNDVAKIDAAEQRYSQAQKAAPAKSYLYYDATMSLARVLELRSKDAEALEIYKKIIAERPSPFAAPAKGKDGEDAAAGGIEGFVRTQIQENMSKISFASMAELASERLEATSLVLPPKAEPATAAADGATSAPAVAAPAPANP